ncbi:hypothetical protein I6N91_08970 [Arthrobacter sp. MSA 4-2]|uniref:hypothetical protein n=1 Tax=Arthrobacter sp. MSA 4-2 TaxID=2794349 RepID=UPI0018E898B0|nr:hypothetical protein [Arthrobacter sp. MSA 4-2]MBJ2121108.1 hypothetical protein [Arthrobacter sp. MSA 4-2]
MKKVKPGDGHALQRVRWWQLFSRSVFHLPVSYGNAPPETWSVDIRHGGDSNGEVYARLYRDGINTARSKVPAVFPVPGGRIEVATSAYGLRRCHYVTDDGTQRQLIPDHASAEGRRAHLERTHPALSRTMGAASVVVLLLALVLGLPQIIEQLTSIPLIAESLGTLNSPVHMPQWMNGILVVAAIAASTERALRLRYSRILDGGILDGDA